jgi:hypothetical protein
MMTLSPSVAIVRDPGDAVAAAGPARWAESQLVDALAARGVSVVFRQPLEHERADALRVVLSGLGAPVALSALERTDLAPDLSNQPYAVIRQRELRD